MNSNTTLTAILAGALLVAVLAIGGLAATTLFGPGQAQAQDNGIVGMRQITVVGRGESRIAPDMATVQIGVETQAATTQEALAENNTQAQAIIDQLTALGIAERDIQTSGFNIYPNYDNDGRQITGYSVSNTVSVIIRDLQQAGALLDQVVQAGANRVYGINFGVSDTSAVLAEARQEAIEDALARATQFAQASSANVGQVLVISENVGSGPVVPMPAMMADRAESAAVPVQAGEQNFTVQVQVTYELR
ncbi:MAG: SIMPL domain-containing protein [Oscillochloris sp.]|nr:SIMPL domain-containing protein [Oscillochloris sp.]